MVILCCKPYQQFHKLRPQEGICLLTSLSALMLSISETQAFHVSAYGCLHLRGYHLTVSPAYVDRNLTVPDQLNWTSCIVTPIHLIALTNKLDQALPNSQCKPTERGRTFFLQFISVNSIRC